MISGGRDCAVYTVKRPQYLNLVSDSNGSRRTRAETRDTELELYHPQSYCTCTTRGYIHIHSTPSTDQTRPDRSLDLNNTMLRTYIQIRAATPSACPAQQENRNATLTTGSFPWSPLRTLESFVREVGRCTSRKRGECQGGWLMDVPCRVQREDSVGRLFL